MSSGKVWSSQDEKMLARLYRGGMTNDLSLATYFQRTVKAVKSRRVVLGLVDKGRKYSHAELARLRKLWTDHSAKEIAVKLNRSVSSIFSAIDRYKLPRKGHRWPQETLDLVRRMNGRGLSDMEISREIKSLSRDQVHHIRMRLKLTTPEEAKQRGYRRALDGQRKTLGIKSAGELRQVSFRRYAVKHGLPEDLRPRAVQMVYAMAQCGAMTRRQIAEKIGMPWKGARKSLVSNDPEGTYLSNLMSRGIVFCLPRIVQAGGQGQNISLYDLTLEWRERITRHVQQQANSTAGKSA